MEWWSWAGSLAEVRQRRQHAQRLTGLQLAAVRYCEIGYAMPGRPVGQEGPRLVVSAAEWQEPPFRHEFGIHHSAWPPGWPSPPGSAGPLDCDSERAAAPGSSVTGAAGGA